MTSHPSFCRYCHNGCPILVEVADGRVVSITGDHDNPVYQGYTCVKGRALPEEHNHPDRLWQSQKRMPDGSYRPIASDQLLTEVADRLQGLIDTFGPNSVAIYTGTKAAATPTAGVLCQSFLDVIGSTMRFTSDTIDQPGKHVAKGLHGMWMAPPQGFDDPDVGLIIGGNPLVSYLCGLPTGNPGRRLQEWFARGYRLIVIDPRRSDIAKRATIHLQPRPGEDVTIIAGMLRVILTEGLHDHDFVASDVSGVETLRETVDPFTPDYVAERADIAPDQLIDAARMFATARRGYAVASTGPNMSGPGTLLEYLVLNLNTVCGRWLRAGERVAAPFTVQRTTPARAQAMAPFPAHGMGEPLPATGLTASLAGLPTAALADEMLSPDDHRIRALLTCGGNPVAVWPDQEKTVRAMEALDLLVQIDIRMSATAWFADYVVAPKMSLEVPSFTAIQDVATLYGAAYTGYAEPWAQWTDAVVEPPPGSDLLEEWEFFYGVAQRMGLKLDLGPIFEFWPVPRIPLDMEHKPSTEELLGLIATGSRVDLEEVKRHPRGALFPEPAVVVEPKETGCTARLDVANSEMMADLTAVRAEQFGHPEVLPTGEALDFRLIPRRMQEAYNSSIPDTASLRTRPYNPAFMNPDDVSDLGLVPDSIVEIRSSRSAIRAVVRPDKTLRRGLVSMTHAWGGVPGRDGDVREVGSSTSLLVNPDEGLQPYTGQPRMSNIPVSVSPVAEHLVDQDGHP